MPVVVAVKGLSAREGGTGHSRDVGMLPCIWSCILACVARGPELSSSTLQLYACTVTFMGKMHGLISSWRYQSWYCSSASNDIEKFTACAASGCVPCGPPALCFLGSGWVSVPSSSLCLPPCLGKISAGSWQEGVWLREILSLERP